MPHGYIVWDSKFRVQGWNAAAEMIFGWSAEEARGKHAHKLIVPPDVQPYAHQMWKQLLRGGESTISVKKNISRDGKQLICEWYNTPLRDAAGKVIGVLSMVHDITGRKQMEAELSKGKKFLQTVIETEPECVKLIDATGALIMMNRAGLSMIQADSFEQVKGRSIYPLVLPEYRDMFRTITKEVFEGKSGALTFEIMGIKGRRLWLETHAVPLRNDEDEIIALLGITRDVTERKQAEEAILEQKQYAEDLVANSVVATFVLNPRHKVVLWNRACEELTGIPALDIVGTDNHWKAFYDRKRPALADIIIDGTFGQLPSLYNTFTRSALIPNGLQAEGWYQNLNGRDRYIIFDAAPVYNSRGELAVVIETVHDATERKQTEEVLKRELDFTAAVLDTVGSMVMVLDRQGRIVQFNRTCEEVSGYTFEEVQGKHVWDFLLPPEQVEAIKAVFKNLISGRFPNKYENHWVAKDGSRKLIAWSNTALLAPDGSVEFVVPTGIDITGRERADEALLQEKRFSDAIINSLSGIFCICDENGRLIRWIYNEKEVTGYSMEELMHMNVLELFREDRDIVAKAIQEAFTTGRAAVEARLVTKSGAAIPFFLSGLRMSMDHKQYLVGVGLDISERKQLEDQLRQAQKMASIGTLAGGIAHDFNNILTAIIGYGNLLNLKMPIDDPLRHKVDQILSSASRATQLARSLLAYSGKRIINPQPVSLNEIVRKLEPFLVRLIREDVELMTALTDEDATVRADSGQIEQALMNLATNARAAMPDGGTLHIDTDLIDLDDEFARTHPGSKPGKYATISVTDSGTGMDEKTRQKIYEPFLTAKEVGKGTGLGLAMVYGMVKQHNGYIDVTSEVGKGTTFVIYLPAVQAEIPEAKPAGAVFVKEGGETILVADDDEAIRGLTKDMLEEFGYTVLLAEDGEDALNKFRENRDKIQLLLFDVIMPKKNGKDVYEEIKGMNPAVKAIFLSGYAADLIQRKGVLEEGLNFIVKPFAVNTLLDEVRRVLNS
jgi:two-component system NtrC family sensor kinase